MKYIYLTLSFIILISFSTATSLWSIPAGFHDYINLSIGSFKNNNTYYPIIINGNTINLTTDFFYIPFSINSSLQNHSGLTLIEADSNAISYGFIKALYYNNGLLVPSHTSAFINGITQNVSLQHITLFYNYSNGYIDPWQANATILQNSSTLASITTPTGLQLSYYNTTLFSKTNILSWVLKIFTNMQLYNASQYFINSNTYLLTLNLNPTIPYFLIPIQFPTNVIIQQTTLFDKFLMAINTTGASLTSYGYFNNIKLTAGFIPNYRLYLSMHNVTFYNNSLLAISQNIIANATITQKPNLLLSIPAPMQISLYTPAVATIGYPYQYILIPAYSSNIISSVGVHIANANVIEPQTPTLQYQKAINVTINSWNYTSFVLNWKHTYSTNTSVGFVNNIYRTHTPYAQITLPNYIDMGNCTNPQLNVYGTYNSTIPYFIKNCNNQSIQLIISNETSQAYPVTNFAIIKYDPTIPSPFTTANNLLETNVLLVNTHIKNSVYNANSTPHTITIINAPLNLHSFINIINNYYVLPSGAFSEFLVGEQISLNTYNFYNAHDNISYYSGISVTSNPNNSFIDFGSGIFSKETVINSYHSGMYINFANSTTNATLPLPDYTYGYYTYNKPAFALNGTYNITTSRLYSTNTSVGIPYWLPNVGGVLGNTTRPTEPINLGTSSNTLITASTIANLSNTIILGSNSLIFTATTSLFGMIVPQSWLLIIDVIAISIIFGIYAIDGSVAIVISMLILLWIMGLFSLNNSITEIILAVIITLAYIILEIL